MGDAFSGDRETDEWTDENKPLSQITHSFSGGERNHIFANENGKAFYDLSGISGLDSASDGRVSVWLDYDHDGQLDLAIANSNRPLLQLFHNRLGSPESKHHSLKLRLVGGNRTSQPSTQFGSRDGWGAKIRVRAGQLTLLREHVCGAGFSGRNSETMLVGIGEQSVADEVTVIWPSGRKQSLKQLPTDRLIVIYENAADCESSLGFTTNDYTQQTHVENRPPSDSVRPEFHAQKLFEAAGTKPQSESLVVITTMASWCVACAKLEPQLQATLKQFKSEEIAMIGFAADPDDQIEDLQRFIKRLSIEYPVVLDPTSELRTEVQTLLESRSLSDALPSSLILSSDGRLLHAQSGVPTVSTLNRLLRATSVKK